MFSRRFQDCLKEVLGCFKDASRVLEECFTAVLWVCEGFFQGCLREGERVLHECLKSVEKEASKYCSAWPSLKLNTKIGLKHHLHHTPPPTHHKLLAQLGLVGG